GRGCGAGARCGGPGAVDGSRTAQQDVGADAGFEPVVDRAQVQDLLHVAPAAFDLPSLRAVGEHPGVRRRVNSWKSAVAAINQIAQTTASRRGPVINTCVVGRYDSCEHECGLGEFANSAGADGDPLEGSPATGEQREATFRGAGPRGAGRRRPG